MGKYVLKRLLHGLFSIFVVIAIVMTLIYGLLDRNLVLAKDGSYSKQKNNVRTTYRYQKWEDFGYVDYATFADYLISLRQDGEITEEQRAEAVKLGRESKDDSALTAEYAAKFTEYYESQGYTVERLDAVLSRGKIAEGGNPALYAYRDSSIPKRLLNYFKNLIYVDNIHYVPEEVDVGERGLTFTTHDPLAKGKFSPAIIGSGTKYKYLLYFDGQFPYLHQNLATINLGVSYSVTRGVDVFTTMTQSQGAWVQSSVTYPTGLTELSANDLHTASYVRGSLATSDMLQARFTDDYTSTRTTQAGLSRLGYSFIIGILATILQYFLGLPLGVLMARHKEGLLDKAGTVYIMFISAVPSLAYIFLFKGIGGSLGLPTMFDTSSPSKLMYVLPIISLALPSVASMMKWMRRYMIDQMNSDYVKFARSGGMSDTEIFFKHIMKVAIIPIVQGIPGAVLFAMTGAIITERVYLVPGAGGLLTEAVNQYDNSVIVGVTLFYAVLAVLSTILGDVLMAAVDPRISFTEKAR